MAEYDKIVWIRNKQKGGCYAVYFSRICICFFTACSNILRYIWQKQKKAVYLRSLYGDYENDPPSKKQRSHHKYIAYKI